MALLRIMVYAAVVRSSPFSKVYMFDMREVKRISRFKRQCTVVCITNCRLLFARMVFESLKRRNCAKCAPYLCHLLVGKHALISLLLYIQ